MLFETHRCKHCHRTYQFQLSGSGCVSPYSDKDYCPECAKAIHDALKSIPVAFEKRYKEIPFDKNLMSELALVRTNESGKMFCVMMKFTNVPCAEADVFLYKGHTYAVGKTEDGIERMFVLCEYDLEKDEFTGNEWKDEGVSDTAVGYWKEGNLAASKIFSIDPDKVSSKEMPKFEPIKINYFDLVKNDKPKNKK